MAPMNTTLAPLETTHDPKRQKFLDIVTAAYNKAAMSEPEKQRVNDTSGLNDLITNFITLNRTRKEFADEETKSSYGYLSGYKQPESLTVQMNRLRELFPGLGYANQELLAKIEQGEVELPKHAEGWFAIPNWMKNPEIFGSTYSEAVQKVLDTIKKKLDRKFYNYRAGEVDEKHLRQSARSEQFWKNLAETQGNPDILFVAAQFGIRHRGRSVRRTLVVMGDTSDEFGLGAFAIGIMLLTNPIRLKHYDDLWIDAPGDEWSPGGDGVFSRAPRFCFDGGLGFGAEYVSRACDVYGSVSAFVPQ
jgi:hypothetical protein